MHPLLLWSECSEPSALEHVIFHSLGWKGDSSIPSYLVPSNLAQGLGKDRWNQGSVDSTCVLPRKKGIGELQKIQLEAILQPWQVSWHWLPSERSIPCCASLVKLFRHGTPHLCNSQREISWRDIARYFFLVDFFFFFLQALLKKRVIWIKGFIGLSVNPHSACIRCLDFSSFLWFP